MVFVLLFKRPKLRPYLLIWNDVYNILCEKAVYKRICLYHRILCFMSLWKNLEGYPKM